jgi:glycopeptide antibiotics resistance protein
MDALRYVPLLPLLLAVLVSGLIAALAAAPALRRRDPPAAATVAARVLLGGAALSIAGLSLGGGGAEGMNLIPGAGIRDMLDNVNQDLGLLNVFGNVLMYMPVGALLPLATTLSPRAAITACAAMSVTIEALQLVTARSLDVDDVLLNTIGGLIGVSIAAVIRESRVRDHADV